MFIDIGVKLNFFNFSGRLMLAGLLFFLFDFITVFTVIDNATNRRIGIGRDFYEIQSALMGQTERFAGGYDADLTSVKIDASDF